jgi:hypothetical protein
MKMKDINEILNKMSEISSENAITREDLLEILPAIEDSLPATADPFLGCTFGYVVLPNCFTIPRGNFPTANTKITFCTDNLTCCVKPVTITVPSPCGGSGIPVTVYALNLVGCIPWIANGQPVEGDCTSIAPVSVSFNDIFCVNRIVGYYATEAEARAACTSIDCRNILAALTVTGYPNYNCDKSVIVFSVRFNTTIGNCP